MCHPSLQGGTLIGRVQDYDYTVSVVDNSNFTMTGGKIDAYSHKNETIYTTKGTRISNGYVKAVSADNSAFYTKGNMNIT